MLRRGNTRVAECETPGGAGAGQRRRRTREPGRVVLSAALVLSAACAASPSRPVVLPEVPVTPADLRVQPANNSPVLAVDPTDRDFVVLANRLDNPDFGCSLHVSHDGGRSWLPADPVPRLPPGARVCYAPEVGFAPDGTLYFLFLGLHGRGNQPMGAFLTTSSDRGRSFTSPRRILGPHSYMVRLAVHPETGRLHLVWLRASSDPPLGGLPPPPNPLLASRSDDGGRTWSAPVQVGDPARLRVAGPAVAVRGEEVHVLYYDLREDARDYHGLEGPTWQGRWSLLLSSSSDGGGRFRRTVVVDDAVVPPERVMVIFTMPPPALALEPDGGVVAAWHDARNGDWDVWSRRSPDGGATWGGRERVNDDPVGNGRHQYLPRLAVAEDGRVDVVFYDRRRDPRNVYTDVTYASRPGGAAPFGPNTRVTSESFNSRSGTTYAIPSAAGLVEFGSRLALVAEPGRAISAWTDTRNSPDVIEQDVFVTEIRRPRGFRTAPAAAALTAVAALGLGLLAVRRRRRPAAPVALALAASSLLASCRPLSPPAATTGPPTITVRMDEYRFEHPVRLAPGRVVFRVENAGRRHHELLVAILPPGVPPILEQLRGSRRRTVAALAQVPTRAPGRSGTFAVDLASGRYALLCFVRDPDGRSHADKGMASEIRVP